ncbi:MAG: hypothetical protein NC453_28535 [Muribaculum sp.]|nr:hypothetical protein [Muribaculum sp.]
MREEAEIAFSHLKDDYRQNRESERSLKSFRDSYAILETERRLGFALGYAESLAQSSGKSGDQEFIIRKVASFGIPVEDIAQAYGMYISEVKSILDSNLI